jgi:hypothetical protein
VTDLIIRASAADLEELRRRIELEVGRDARLEPVTGAQAGQLREPILIALIVALGGEQLTRAVAEVIKRYLDHKERMQQLADDRAAKDADRQVTLALLGADDTEQPTTVAELMLLADA